MQVQRQTTTGTDGKFCDNMRFCFHKTTAHLQKKLENRLVIFIVENVPFLWLFNVFYKKRSLHISCFPFRKNKQLLNHFDFVLRVTLR